MRQEVLKTWPLFFGLAMIMVGNSLQGTLLGVRANIEDFSVFTTGLIMTAYYVGFLGGSIFVPRLVANVGHIRVFAALASIASTTVLLHGLYIHPIGWGFIRVITGFAYAGLYIVVESWLNDASTNENRGRMLGLYMLITYVGMVGGQMLLNIASPSDIELFVITSVLVSLALLPISLSRRPAPDFSASETIHFMTIWSRSPLGVAGMVMSGFASAVVFSLGSVFVLEVGFDIAKVSIFMAAFILGGVVLQMPISWISDRMDRRKVIVGLCICSAASCGIIYAGLLMSFWILAFGIFVFGAFSLPVYGQCVSHVNDHLLPRQFVAASATLLLLNGAGAAFGPLVISGVMQILGGNGFVLSLLVAFVSLSIFSVYRTFRGDAVPLDEQSDSFYMPARGSVINVYGEEQMEQEAEDAKN